MIHCEAEERGRGPSLKPCTSRWNLPNTDVVVSVWLVRVLWYPYGLLGCYGIRMAC